MAALKRTTAPTPSGGKQVWKRGARKRDANQMGATIGRLAGKAPSDRPALKPYWGKPAVRNFRGGDGNVGIIRSPVRAIALPDFTSAMNYCGIVASLLIGPNDTPCPPTPARFLYHAVSKIADWREQEGLGPFPISKTARLAYTHTISHPSSAGLCLHKIAKQALPDNRRIFVSDI